MYCKAATYTPYRAYFLLVLYSTLYHSILLRIAIFAILAIFATAEDVEYGLMWEAVMAKRQKMVIIPSDIINHTTSTSLLLSTDHIIDHTTSTICRQSLRGGSILPLLL